ncbi:MAG: M14 family zinc carboxypeptidase, partial [Eubacteriales bacterium]|nr:M14 family zinc carboxypeptidase [Eubacteriales bacterium]
CSQKYLSRPSWLVQGMLKLQSLGQQPVRLGNDDVKERLTALAAQYPDAARLQVIGQSVWGEDLYALVVGDADAPHALMVQGGIHAREYATAELVLAQAQDLLEQNAAGASYGGRRISDLLGAVNVWFLPLLNPDGALLCQQGLSAAPAAERDTLLERNNGIDDFTRWKANAVGVDLNANFDALWRVNPDVSLPFGNGYAGPEPFSEPETQAVKDLVEQHDFMTMLCYHSAGEVIYWYFGQQDDDRQRDLALAEGLAQQNGYRVVQAGREITSVAGSKDWFVQQYGRPGFTVELFAMSAVPVTQDVLRDAVERNLGAVVYLLDEAASRATGQ